MALTDNKLQPYNFCLLKIEVALCSVAQERRTFIHLDSIQGRSALIGLQPQSVFLWPFDAFNVSPANQLNDRICRN
jgi:hypothetical protein